VRTVIKTNFSKNKQLISSGPCTFDSTLCKNEGQCVDDPTIEKRFKCICSNQFQGEYCEKGKRDI
jgi:hypothetical protein